jgi:hypothetical protein
MGSVQRPGDVSVAEVRASVIEDTRAKIAQHGWTVVGVFPTPEDPGVPFAYTVGLSGKRLPELAIYGLPVQVGPQVLNAVARQMVSAGGPLASGQRIDDVLDGGLSLVAVEMTATEDLNLVREVYGAVEAAVQVCWPDLDGLMPWEQGCSLCADDQPVHGVAPLGRAVYRATRLLSVVSALDLAELVADVPKGELTLVDAQADNDRRAGWAARGLIGYATHLGQGGLKAELSTTAEDMLGDLRHLFDALGLDWVQALSSVEANYRAEIFGKL